MNPRVVAVKANPDFTLELTFENGQERIFDMKPYLSIGVFKELANPTLFKTVKPCFGSISWKNGQDLCPDTLYMDSKKTYGSVSRHRRDGSQHKASVLAVAEPRAKYRKR